MPAPQLLVRGRRMARSQVYWPRPVEVFCEEDGRPRAVEGVAVGGVREEWEVEDRWWTPRPLRRRYFELVLADGRNLVVFREFARQAEGDPSGVARGCRWFEQRA